MAFFKCTQTGNVTEFVNDHDIVQMRSHPSYEEVEQEVKPAAKSKKTVAPAEEV
jgi:hypothetical protein